MEHARETESPDVARLEKSVASGCTCTLGLTAVFFGNAIVLGLSISKEEAGEDILE